MPATLSRPTMAWSPSPETVNFMGGWHKSATLGVLAVAAAAISPQFAFAVTVNFDSFSGMNFLGATVPAASRLSNQLQPATGATFSSDGGAAYAAVVNLEVGSPSAHAPTPPNGIGAATQAGNLTYSIPIVVTFSDPSNSSVAAITDFVSIRGDLRPIAGLIYLQAYNVSGSLIASDTKPDSVGTLLSVSALGIHSVKFNSATGSVAFDNLTFNAVTPVPEPKTLLLLIAGLAVIGIKRQVIGKFASMHRAAGKSSGVA